MLGDGGEFEHGLGPTLKKRLREWWLTSVRTHEVRTHLEEEVEGAVVDLSEDPRGGAAPVCGGRPGGETFAGRQTAGDDL